MVALKQIVAQTMRDDPVLATLLTGGVYAVAQIAPGMTAPHPFDENGLVRPSALVRYEASSAAGPRQQFLRQFILLFFYDSAGYEAITEAMSRARALLHEKRIGSGAYEIWHVDSVDDQYDDALLAFMHRARYEVAVRG